MIQDPRLGRRALAPFATAVTAVAAIAAVMSSQACTDAGTSPTPSITISISARSVVVVQGGSAEFVATLTGRGGFTGAGATFAPTGAPVGITFAVSNVQTVDSVTTARVTASVAATVAPGTYTINLTGSGTGVGAVSASFELIVPVPAVDISVDRATATVTQGGTASIEATLYGIGGFTGSGAAFAVTGAPAGVTLGVSNLKKSGSITTATVTMYVAPTVPIGVYALNVIGSGTGVSAVSTPFTLTVLGVGFTLSVNPATLSLYEGGPALPATITITRVDGFTGPVALSVTSPTDGVGGGFHTEFSPASTIENSSILTVRTSVAIPGIYILTITGAAPGYVSQTTTIAVTVP